MSINTHSTSLDHQQDAQAEITAWYQELEQNLQQQEACEDLSALERLQEDELQITQVIIAMEASLLAPPKKAAEDSRTEESHTAVRTVVRTEVEQALQPEQAGGVIPASVEGSIDDQCDRLVDQLAVAQDVEAITTIFLSVHPDALLQWARHVSEWIQFDAEGLLIGAWDKRIQFWMQALSAAKYRLPAFVDHGILTGRQAGDAIRACNQSRGMLQEILRRHPTADEKEGPTLGRRNKPSVVTDNGDHGTIQPISGAAARATWTRTDVDDGIRKRTTA